MAKKNKNGAVEMTTVYKETGNSIKVNSDMLPHLADLKLSKEKPKAA